MSESIEVQVARHDEQLKALVPMIKDEFTDMKAALRDHAADDAVIAEQVRGLVQASAVRDGITRKQWALMGMAFVAVQGVVQVLYHFMTIAPALARLAH